MLFFNELVKTKQNDLCLRVAVMFENCDTFVMLQKVLEFFMVF